jgi:DHA2 family multidrug resistance protein
MSEVASLPTLVIPAGRRRMIVAAVMLASVMQTIDTTIANVALPHMQGSLSTTQEQMGWVLTSYIVAAAIMTPLTGWLADQYGRKRLMLLSIVGFTAASALCGLAESLPQIILFRVLQGLSGAALIPISQAILFDIYPKEQHPRAMAMWSFGVVLGPMLGPALGGYLTDQFSWRWVFLVNVPFGILAAVMVMAFFRRRPGQRSSFDFFGFAALSVAVGAMQLFLDRGSTLDWFASTEIIIEAVVAAFALYLFVVHSLTVRRPFVSLALFRDWNFISGSLLMTAVGTMVYAPMVVLPPMLQTMMGYTAMDAGIAMGPRSFGGLLSMLVVIRLMKWLDARVIIGIGMGMAALGLWNMSLFSPAMGLGPVIWTGLELGIGVGLCIVPLSTIAFATLPAAHRNEGSAMYTLTRNLGMSVGISVVQALTVRNTQIQHAVLAGHLTPYRLAELHATTGSLPALNALVTGQATMVAYIDDFRLISYFTIVLMPLLLFVHKPGSGPVRDQHAVVE